MHGETLNKNAFVSFFFSLSLSLPVSIFISFLFLCLQAHFSSVL